MPPHDKGITKAATKSAYRLKDLRLTEEGIELDYLLRDTRESGDLETSRGHLGRRKQVLVKTRDR